MMCIEWYWFVAVVVMSVAVGMLFGFIAGTIMGDWVLPAEEDEDELP